MESFPRFVYNLSPLPDLADRVGSQAYFTDVLAMITGVSKVSYVRLSSGALDTARRVVVLKDLREEEDAWREVSFLYTCMGNPAIEGLRAVVSDVLIGSTYMVMELCEASLDDVPRIMEASGQFFGEHDVGFIMKQILSGLREMHAKGIVHRDLKPMNILWRAKGTLQPLVVKERDTKRRPSV
ncbi:hypothetical protein PR202_ga24416 [Eleusine coracana subsp. coracana]|uniref:Protein kinase domain-containing protein n=1 Tax=Eleusine coracana subsp. coracana TaxID=191504 RepID=A0AAV5D7W5_ELECO|nr:hypothetical protein PR202_ga24416 [Eleusine coracana subsp. coracana]